MQPLTFDDPRAEHGAERAYRNARLARAGRATGALRLSRKNRLPATHRHVSDVANAARAELQAEMIARFGTLRVIHAEVLDLCYWADVGTLRAAAYLENVDWMDEKLGDLKPVVATVVKLKKLKLEALKSIGLDRERDSTAELIAQLYSSPAPLSPIEVQPEHQDAAVSAPRAPEGQR